MQEKYYRFYPIGNQLEKQRYLLKYRYAKTQIHLHFYEIKGSMNFNKLIFVP